MSTQPSAVVRRVSVVVAVIVLVVAVSAVIRGLVAAGPGATETHVLPVGVARLRVDVDAGDVTVKAGADGEVRVKRTVHNAWRAPTYTEESGPDGVRIAASCPALSFGACSVDYTLTVPADMRTNLMVSSGDVRVSGLSAAATVVASSGNIAVTDLTGRTDLEASSGDIDVSDVSGQLLLHASSGGISARDVRSGSVAADCSSGDVRLTFVDPPGRVDVSASSGDVTLLLPDGGTAYDVEVSTSSGSKEVDVPTDPGASNRLRVEVSSGDVVLRRR